MLAVLIALLSTKQDVLEHLSRDILKMQLSYKDQRVYIDKWIVLLREARYVT